MGLRPAKCYRELERPYTRVAIRVPRRNYVGANPGLRLRVFNVGNSMRDFSHIVEVRAGSDAQVRDNALESVRMTLVKRLTKKLGKENFFLRVHVYPYHVLRENKQAQGAGADRVSTGMSHAFGVAIGRAAQVHKGQRLISILVDEQHIKLVEEIINSIKPKLPCKVFAKVHTDVASIGTKPRKVRFLEEKEEEGEEKEGEKEEAKEEEKKESEKKEEKEKKG